MPWPAPVTLAGAHARLEPLSIDHAAALAEAVRDGELWKLWYTSVPTPEGMAAEIERRLALQAAGSMLPFASFDAAGRAVGMTTYMNIDATNRRVEIGSTWTAARMQRSPFNTECKLLLLGHAFDKLDGILRSHARSADGSLRDTCVYSIVRSEWPTVRAHLRWQLERPRGAT